MNELSTVRSDQILRSKYRKGAAGVHYPVFDIAQAHIRSPYAAPVFQAPQSNTHRRIPSGPVEKIWLIPSSSRLTPSSGVIPPPLPPTVEEAYRSKCIQLKARMNEVEESNDASRSRLVRIQRTIEKMRLERAFLLEQLSKRTSTNVEDSEGSPSPPSTVRSSPCSSL